MGVLTKIAGHDWVPREPQAYSVAESSTPIAVTDTSGAVASFTVTFHASGDSTRWLLTRQREIELSDSRKGFMIGTVDSVAFSVDTSLVTLTCISKLGVLNLFNIQAQPYSGTLGGAFIYYLSLAGVTSDYVIDSTVADIPVDIIGWKGELWHKLKALVAAHRAEISLVSGRIVLRPIRGREAIRGRDIARAPGFPGSPIAQFVEVYQYETEAIDQEPIYPAGGWSDDVEIITVTAGETIEQILELDASVYDVQQPVYMTTIPPEYNASSVYNIVGSDGRPVSEEAWLEHGGGLQVTINEDTTSVTLRLTGATKLPSVQGGELASYSIAMASAGSGNLYSSLRLIGNGVRYIKTLHRFATGIPAERAQTEVGITIDNPFLTTLNQVFTAGARAAREYAGRKLTLTGTVTAINQIGDRGVIGLPSHGDIKMRYAGMTYADVKAALAGQTYGDIRASLQAERRDEYDNQVWGNVSGARVWDAKTKRFYRIRNATSVRESIQFDAEDDLAYVDVKERYAGMTYAQVKALYAGRTYGDVAVMGLVDV